MHKLGRQQLKQAEEINITAFMNLMVILVPFLLITAVFSRMTVLDLNLPGLYDKEDNSKKVELSLELILKNDAFDILDSNVGLINHFVRTENKTDWNTFSKILLEIKRRFPKTTSISILVNPDVPYKTLIHVMDHVKSMQLVQDGSVETVQLFPDIAIGNASPMADVETEKPVTQN